MPWTIKDVGSHKKGLTPSQKKKWVNIANGVYKDCMAKGGSDKTCAPKAIRIANSKFEEDTMPNAEVKKFKNSVLQMTDPEALFVFKAGDEGSKANVEIVAYSGKDIPHFWWGKLAIDLTGMTHKKVIPFLEQHDLAKKLGFLGKPTVTDDFRLTHNSVNFVDTPFSEEFQKLSQQGFPYEASIYAKPSVIEDVRENQTVEVNGRKFTGPGSIFRQWEYKEVSACVFGADKNTKAKAFSEDSEFEVTVFSEKETVAITKKEVKTMDIEKLKEEDPIAYQKLMDAIKEEAKKEVEEQFKDTVTNLQTSLASAEENIKKFEKSEEIRREKEIKLEADNIWTKLLSKSGIPERLHEKVKAQVNYEKFIKEGSLDTETFSNAITTEFKDWEGIGSQSVEGFGGTEKEVVDDEIKAELEENKAWVEKMLTKAGQKKN
jgi:hypothetical protein